MPNYWLFKSEPDAYSLDDLKRDKKTFWDGVRNYQARNLLRDQVKKGDEVFFYHSNAKPPGVAGVCKVVKEGYPDASQFDKKSKYYDAKSSPDNPRWFGVEVKYVAHLPRLVGLPELKEVPGLEDMVLLNRSRLSVQPVSAKHWKIINGIAKT